MDRENTKYEEEQSLTDVHPIRDGKYRIEDGKGNVLQEENGHLTWSKWNGQKSQIWKVEYHQSSYLNPSGYTLSSEENPGSYVYWDRGNNGKGTKVLIGEYSQDIKYTKNWHFKHKDLTVYAIENGHAPWPYLSNDVLSITSDSSLSSFCFNSDLTLPETTSYSLVFTSDPQYPWTDKTDSGQYEDEKTKKARSEQLIKEQYNDINSYNNSTSNVTNIMINGDVTAFGHGWQWKKMDILLPLLNRQYYIALGNHDIENNQGDSYQDNCFKRSLSKLYQFKSQNDIPRNNITRGRSCQSYAIEFPGNLFALQLNNDPTMEYTPKAGGTPAIAPNFDWIEDELRYAYGKKYNIIINVHKPDNWQHGPSNRFKELLHRYNVKAIFGGHYHYSLGQQWQYGSYFGSVPVYLSGSSSQKKYLITEYTEKKMDIYTVTEDNWKKTKTLKSTVNFD